MKRPFFVIIASLFGISLFGQPRNIPTINDTIYVIEPIVDFYYIIDKKNIYRDSILNIKNSECVIFGIDSFFTDRAKLKVLEMELFDDSCLINEVKRVYKFLDTEETSLYDTEESNLMPLLHCSDSVLEKRGAKYALFITSEGFKRSKEDYNKAMVKDVALSALTLGMFMAVPYESYQELKLCLYNCETREVIVYKTDIMIDSDPDSRDDVYDQVSDILRRKFKVKKKKRK